MANPSTISRGNIIGQWVLAVTLSPTTCSASTTTLQSFTVNGLLPGDSVDISTAAVIAYGLGIVNSRVTAANTLQIEYLNATNLTLTPTTNAVYVLEVSRPENLISNESSLSQIT